MKLGGLLKAAAVSVPKSLNCEVLVIGGGSGGLACAQAAARKGASVVMCDYVTPSETKNSTWGLGGTCVNVGCVPKKLFHRAGLIGHSMLDGEMKMYGYESLLGASRPVADWNQVRSTVQNYIKMLNFTYRNALPTNLTYVNGVAKFDSNNRVIVSYPNMKSGEQTIVDASKAIVIAVGGRPIIPDIPGAREFGISSDDIFAMKQAPGRTLVIGSSYIGLETASFLNGMGYPVSLLVRSKPLRAKTFDSDSVAKIMDLIISSGINVIKGNEIKSLTKVPSGILAHFTDGSHSEFDTVMFGAGRRPETAKINLPKDLGVDESGKIKVNKGTFEAESRIARSDLPKIYAIGDCAASEAPELTPVAIRQGELVASLVTLGQASKDYDLRRKALDFVPSTVFTIPSEYSRVGMSEEEAIEAYGKENVEVFIKEWQPLEPSAAHVHSFEGSEGVFRGFAKLVCNSADNNRVVGLHLISPNSGEAIHALGLACSLGACKEDFDARVLGVHPTDGEALTDMSVSKSSGQDYKVAAGCGGGKCG